MPALKLPGLAAVVSLFALSLWLTLTLCDVAENPDPTTLRIEDFDPFETSADPRGA